MVLSFFHDAPDCCHLAIFPLFRSCAMMVMVLRLSLSDQPLLVFNFSLTFAPLVRSASPVFKIPLSPLVHPGPSTIRFRKADVFHRPLYLFPSPPSDSFCPALGKARFCCRKGNCLTRCLLLPRGIPVLCFITLSKLAQGPFPYSTPKKEYFVDSCLVHPFIPILSNRP